jgi:hypothetical protein
MGILYVLAPVGVIPGIISIFPTFREWSIVAVVGTEVSKVGSTWLLATMGEDMLAVLNGEKRIELGKLEKTKFKFSMFLRRIFRMF